MRPTAGALRAELLPVAAMRAHLADWADLGRRALENNIFLETAFAAPLFEADAAARRWWMLLVWAENGADGVASLVGLLPIRCPRFGRAVPGGLAVGFRDPMLTCGTPLLDRDRAAEAFAAMLARLALPPTRAVGLVLSEVPADGPFARMVAAGTDLAVVKLDEHRRAALRRVGGNVLSLTSAKSRKERKRQRRRLMEHGECGYSSACTPDAVRRAVERFLLLERKGWKGARGTALLADDRLAGFTRAMTVAMAAEGKCRIDALEMDGRAIAMGIVLTAGGRAHFWKTAFDEEHAPLSPGVQFAVDLAERQLADETVTLTDSCAIPGHPMIDKLWPDRTGVVDFAVATGRGSVQGVAPGFRAAVATEQLRRRVRAAAKARLGAWRRFRRALANMLDGTRDRPRDRRSHR